MNERAERTNEERGTNNKNNDFNNWSERVRRAKQCGARRPSERYYIF